MKVSVIIPTYNRAGTIVRTVESVLAQTVPPSEVIVVDDGSTDDTAATLDRFLGRIRILRQANQGASAARNTGIRAAEGDLIAFLDSDDAWLPTKNERQLDLFRRHADQGITCCVCNARMEYQDGTVRHSFAVAGLHPMTDSGLWCNPAAVLVSRFLLFNQVAVVRRDALERAGLFDESLRIMEDYDLQLRLALTGPWAYLREPLVTWHGGSPGSLSGAATEYDMNLHAYSILEGLSNRPDLWRWVSPANMEERLWQLRSRIEAERLSLQPDGLSRAKGRMLRRALRTWQSIYSRLPSYPRMITSAY